MLSKNSKGYFEEIQEEFTWKYINMNPKPPNVYGLIKLHKQGNPIRPVISWKNAPAYKIAKHLTQIMKQTIPLPNIYIYIHNVANSFQLIEELNKIEVNERTKLCSLI
jgi:hypothetical protein